MGFVEIIRLLKWRLVLAIIVTTALFVVGIDRIADGRWIAGSLMVAAGAWSIFFSGLLIYSATRRGDDPAAAPHPRPTPEDSNR